MTRFRIRELREARGVSQYGLARRLGVTKMAAYYCGIVKGKD